MTSAVLDDIASLAFVAILIPLATGESTISVYGTLLIIGKAIAFFVVITFIGAWLFPTSAGFASKVPVVRNINLRRILSMGEGEYTVLALLLIAVTMGQLAQVFGFHAAVGAYMAGLVINREYFTFHEHRQMDFHKHAQQIIDNVAFTWIGPVFFVVLGTELIFDFDLLITILPFALLLFIGLFVGQVLSASVAARYTGSFDWSDSLMIGFGMLGRAELAFLVMDIAYVEYQIMNVEAFYTLMLATFLLNTSVPLTIRWWKSKYGAISQANQG